MAIRAGDTSGNRESSPGQAPTDDPHHADFIRQRDLCAADQLLPLVYDELRKLAAQKVTQEKPGQTLDATALVHEAYLRLVGNQQFANPRHFLAAAAEAMRRTLIDRARARRSLRRGGDGRREALDGVA